MQITVHGTTYETREQVEYRIAVLTEANETYGASDGRVTEINALSAALPAETVYEVVRDDYEVPCEHPMCALLHRRFHQGGEVFNEWVHLPNGEERLVRVRGVHEKVVRQWVILRDGHRVGNAHATKREALAEAAGHPTV